MTEFEKEVLKTLKHIRANTALSCFYILILSVGVLTKACLG